MLKNIKIIIRSYQSNASLSSNIKLLKKPLDKTIEKLFAKHKENIFYSSYIEDNVVKLGYQKNKALQSLIRGKHKEQLEENAKIKTLPVALKYFSSPEEHEIIDKITEYHPFQDLSKEDYKLINLNKTRKDIAVNDESKEIDKTNWLQDYEFYDEENEVESQYGTSDPTMPVSQVPCGGCGAKLHCAESSLPGYIPSEIFKGRSDNDLKTILCQRCHFLKNYNTALNVVVPPEEYTKMLSSISEKHGLAVIIVDLLDFPCSIWPKIDDIIGNNRPLFIVGNKVDLLPKDSRGYLNHIKQCLIDAVIQTGISSHNIRHVCLISATTGYGVEELITNLHMKWGREGDVFLIGCTNVGKSSLFNTLLRSDYCKVKASTLIQKATASPWPGTTLRMLKFPILRPSDAKLFLRTTRIISERKNKVAEEQLRQEQAKNTGKIQYATLIGHIGQSFKDDREVLDAFSMGNANSGPLSLNENSKEYVHSKWCYDTPGVVQPDQVQNSLTIEELLLVIPKEMIRPRTYLVKPGMSLFLAGLGRVDFLNGNEPIRMTVYASLKLPILICATEAADSIYTEFLGTNVLGVPIPDENRLKNWPPLESSENINLIGESNNSVTVADILFSSAGWVGINLRRNEPTTFRAWTPNKKGIYIRKPALIQYGVQLRGSKIRGSLAYKTGKAFIKQ